MLPTRTILVNPNSRRLTRIRSTRSEEYKTSMCICAQQRNHMLSLDIPKESQTSQSIGLPATFVPEEMRILNDSLLDRIRWRKMIRILNRKLFPDPKTPCINVTGIQESFSSELAMCPSTLPKQTLFMGEQAIFHDDHENLLYLFIIQFIILNHVLKLIFQRPIECVLYTRQRCGMIKCGQIVENAIMSS
jgi:hypothetical protein